MTQPATESANRPPRADRAAAGARAAGRRASALRRARRLAIDAGRMALAGAGGLALAGAAAAALYPMVGHAQESASTGGAIVIPGNAEKDPAALAALAKEMDNAAPVRSSAQVLKAAAQSMAPSLRDTRSADDEFARTAKQAGSVVISSAGVTENATPQMIQTNARPDANGVITIPAPGTAAATAAPNNARPVARAPMQIPSATVPPATRYAVKTVDATQAAASTDEASFDTLASRGEPPHLDANGRFVPARAAGNPAIRLAVAQIPAGVAGSNTAALRAGIQRASFQTAAPVQAVAAVAAPQASNPAVPAGQQDPEAIRRTALAYLQQQAAGLPGKVEITVAPSFPRGLAACSALEPFMPVGTRLWGRMTVGVRCAGDKPWTLYLQARVSIHATYYLAARQINPGETLTAADIVPREGDLAGLPQAVITDPQQAVGSTTLIRVAPGFPLRSDMLRSVSAVTAGQTVRVVAQGSGFAISAEGSAMSNASPGQQVRVKTANGQVLSGIVKDGATVEIQM